LIENITFGGISNLDFNDDLSCLIQLGSLNLSNDINSKIRSIKIDSSTLFFFVLKTIKGDTDSIKQLEVSNVTVSNCNITSNKNIIDIGYADSDNLFQVIFDFMKFSNIVFRSKGNLFSLKHTSSNPVIIMNSEFTQIEKGSILLEGSGGFSKEGGKKQAKTHAHVINSTFSEINTEYTSLFQTQQVVNLHIYDSKFSNIFCFERGAILHGDFRWTNTTIVNSTFVNNTAIEGSLFDLLFRGMIYAIDCKFENNFALKDAIFHVEISSSIQIHNSTITQNYAIKNLMGEIVDSMFPSLIKNTTIHDNFAMTPSEVINEFTIK
jgi:hypothetical protein